MTREVCVGNGTFVSLKLVIPLVLAAFVVGGVLVESRLKLGTIHQELRIRTRDRWTCTDDREYMGRLIERNDLTPVEHRRVTEPGEAKIH
jgi:hypothetical protein